MGLDKTLSLLPSNRNVLEHVSLHMRKRRLHADIVIFLIDLKGFKSILTAGLSPIVVNNLALEDGSMETDVDRVEKGFCSTEKECFVFCQLLVVLHLASLTKRSVGKIMQRA